MRTAIAREDKGSAAASRCFAIAKNGI